VEAKGGEVIGGWFDALRYAKHRDAGRHGEDLAHRFLRRSGFTIVARNYRLASGDAEADLIAWEGPTLAIVEVKSRTSEDYGSPDRAVGEEKRRHLLRVAREYSRKCGVSWELVRLDVVTVIFCDPPRVRLFRGALSTDFGDSRRDRRSHRDP
jgi:putative endonuclease